MRARRPRKTPEQRAIERELLKLDAMPNVRVFETEHQARVAELPRLVTRARTYGPLAQLRIEARTERNFHL